MGGCEVLRLRDLARIGAAELAGLYHAGALEPRHAWAAFRGARKYLEAAVADGLASPREAARRAGICAGCPSRRTRTIGADAAHYCGEPLEERMKESPPTCGCLVAATVGGREVAAGKSVIRGEACPQGRWFV